MLPFEPTAMRPRTGAYIPLRRRRIAVLGARSARKRYCKIQSRALHPTAQACAVGAPALPGIKRRALDWILRDDPLRLCVPAPRHAVAPEVDAAEPAIDSNGFDAIHPSLEHRASRVGYLDRGAPGPSLQVAVDAHQSELSFGQG